MKTSTLKKTFLFIYILITSSLYSQNYEIKVVDLKPVFNENKFPEVKKNDNPKIQDKINTFLQLNHLEHLPNIFKNNPYENLLIDDDNYRTSFYNWIVNESPKNILSIIIEAEFNGAYSEEFSDYNNFDIRNGNKITLNNILSKDGKTALTQILNQKVNLKIKNFLKEAKQTKPSDSEEKETIDEQIRLYEDCLQNNQSYKIDYYDFTFQNDSLTFIRQRCSNHAMRALDDLNTIFNSFLYKEIEKYLSPYGKSLIFDNLKEEKTNSVEGKMFKGKINNKYPITALIQEVSSDNSVQIIYWYDKYNMPIIWTGKFEKNKFILIEENEMDEEITIEASWTNNKIIGVWKNKTTNKTLNLELNEY